MHLTFARANHRIVFGTFIFLNFFLIAAHSSGAVPIGTMFAIVLIWFLISVPLSIAGSFFGFRRPILPSPVRTNQIPRQIPEQVVYLRPIPSVLLSGVLPFGAIFVELYFIMNSIWFHKAYYMFGFLFVCYFIMVCHFLKFADGDIYVCYRYDTVDLLLTLCGELSLVFIRQMKLMIGGGDRSLLPVHQRFTSFYTLYYTGLLNSR